MSPAVLPASSPLPQCHAAVPPRPDRMDGAVLTHNSSLRHLYSSARYTQCLRKYSIPFDIHTFLHGKNRLLYEGGYEASGSHRPTNLSVPEHVSAQSPGL